LPIPLDGHISDNLKALNDWFDNNLDEKTKALHIRRAQMDKDMAEGKCETKPRSSGSKNKARGRKNV